MAIAITTPSVDKEDFPAFALALHRFLQDDHHVRKFEIQRSPMGEAYVCFGCPLEREKFLKDSPYHFGHYWLKFIEHDKGANAKVYDMDREAWLMLLCHPNDFCHYFDIEKLIAGFAILKHVHPSTNDAFVVQGHGEQGRCYS